MSWNTFEKVIGTFEGRAGTQDPTGTMNYATCDIDVTRANEWHDEDTEQQMIELQFQTHDLPTNQIKIAITIPKDEFQELIDHPQ